MEFGLVVRDPTSKIYFLGPGLLFLSRAVLDSIDMRRVAEPYLSKLADQTQSTALLGLISGGRVFVVAKEETTTGIGVTIRIGHRYPLTWGAHGKAIVAFLPEEEKAWCEAKTSRADGAALRKELDEVRRLGYAKDLGNEQSGVHAVAAPIFGSGTLPAGCVIVVGTFPKSSADGFGEKVAATAREISTLLGPTIEGVYRKAG
jgi:DNA-binding IclR family transcriptional regulator